MHFPTGFRGAAVACGIKRDTARLDLALVVSDRPTTSAGVYTTNRVVAAPVMLDRRRTPSADMRAVVLNSGNANACTGKQGERDAERMTELVATACGIRPDQTLVMSTGIIGHVLPMRNIAAGIQAAQARLAPDQHAAADVAQAFMTTDTVPKVVFRRVPLGGQDVTMLGFAKGAGMIAPRMATMLGLILCDVDLDPPTAQVLLRQAAEVSFNSISVDGHTSTNDTLIWMSNAAADRPRDSLEARERSERLRPILREVCVELARAIVNDGEGATHRVEIQVTTAHSVDDARAIARAIADSPLVKTAIAGCDPNWGRIVSAAGYAGVSFDPQSASLRLNGTLIFASGEPATFDPAAMSESLRIQREVHIELDCGLGSGNATFWTCDLTAEYVRINADYHT